MFSRISVSSIIVLTALTWGISLWFFGVELSWQHVKPFSLTIAAVTGALTIFDKWLWRWAPFRWFHGKPDIEGSWDVELLSSYVDRQTGQASASVQGVATIKQTFSTISIRLKTDKNTSFLLAERLIRHGDGASEVMGVYQSDPDIHVRGRSSEIHYGAFRYRIDDNPATQMSGHYWTDRNTAGSIVLKRKKK